MILTPRGAISGINPRQASATFLPIRFIVVPLILNNLLTKCIDPALLAYETSARKDGATDLNA